MILEDETKSSQYKLVTLALTWQDAQYYCRLYYTDLVSVMSLSANEELMMILKANDVSAAWIGLYRESWKWADGSSIPFTLWSPQQPNNDNGSQACVYMQGGSWNDWNCDTKFNFLCEEIIEETSSESTFSLTSGQKTVVKVMLLTNADLADKSVRQRVLRQVRVNKKRRFKAGLFLLL
ncbi:lectin [Parambassis ranga]|uniref:Lectin n=1 Tax=Parambassis ranga TaxID=210632 RepID=A0A6P7I899_9TELE|nr:lectin-like [Parambassis ranga]